MKSQINTEIQSPQTVCRTLNFRCIHHIVWNVPLVFGSGNMLTQINTRFHVSRSSFGSSDGGNAAQMQLCRITSETSTSQTTLTLCSVTDRAADHCAGPVQACLHRFRCSTWTKVSQSSSSRLFLPVGSSSRLWSCECVETVFRTGGSVVHDCGGVEGDVRLFVCIYSQAINHEEEGNFLLKSKTKYQRKLQQSEVNNREMKCNKRAGKLTRASGLWEPAQDNLLIWTLHARRWPISVIGTICWMRWALSSCIGSQQRLLTRVSVYTRVSKTCQTVTSGSEPSTDHLCDVLTDFHVFIRRLLICFDWPRVAEIMLSSWNGRWQDGFISHCWCVQDQRTDRSAGSDSLDRCRVKTRNWWKWVLAILIVLI